MNLLPGYARITTNTSATLGISGKPKRIFSIHAVSIPTATTLTFRDGTSASDTAIIQFNGTASQGITMNINGGAYFKNGCYISTDINLSWVTVFYTEEL